MPKPVKNAAPKKPAAKKRPSSDPNRRAGQLMAEQEAKTQQGKWATPPGSLGDLPITTTNTSSDATRDETAIFDARFRERMSESGRKGGKASGAKRMEMPEKQRKEIARKAAAPRWTK